MSPVEDDAQPTQVVAGQSSVEQLHDRITKKSAVIQGLKRRSEALRCRIRQAEAQSELSVQLARRLPGKSAEEEASLAIDDAVARATRIDQLREERTRLQERVSAAREHLEAGGTVCTDSGEDSDSSGATPSSAPSDLGFSPPKPLPRQHRPLPTRPRPNADLQRERRLQQTSCLAAVLHDELKRREVAKGWSNINEELAQMQADKSEAKKPQTVLGMTLQKVAAEQAAWDNAAAGLDAQLQVFVNRFQTTRDMH